MLDEAGHASVIAAFNRGWRRLLKEELVTASNIETIAAALLEAIMSAAMKGQRSEFVLTAIGLTSVHDKGTQGAAKAGIGAGYFALGAGVAPNRDLQKL